MIIKFLNLKWSKFFAITGLNYFCNGHLIVYFVSSELDNCRNGVNLLALLLTLNILQ